MRIIRRIALLATVIMAAAYWSGGILRADTVELGPEETVVYLVAGDTLILRGPTHARSSYVLDVDGDTSQSDKFEFRWTPQTAGDYPLTVGESRSSGGFLMDAGYATVRQVRALVSMTDPVIFTNLPEACADDADINVATDPQSDFHLSAVDFYVDGQFVTHTGQAPFMAHIPLRTKPTGPHFLSFRATSVDGAHFQRTKQINVYSNVVVVNPADDIVYCAQDDVLQFSGRAPLSADATNFALLVNSQVAATAPVGYSSGDYSFIWSPTDRQVGDNRINIRVNRPTGDYIQARRLHVIVSLSPPVSFRELPDETLDDLALGIEAPADTGFQVTGVTYLINGQQVARSTSRPFDAVVSLAPYPSGKVAVTLVARSADNATYQRTRILTIPARIALANMSPVVKVNLDGAPVDLDCSVAHGFVPVNVSYLIDGHEVGSASAPPYSVNANLNLCASGYHLASVKATDAQGRQYVSAAVPVHVVNALVDQAVPVAAAAAKRANAALERARVAAAILEAHQSPNSQTFLDRIDNLLDRLEADAFETSQKAILERQARAAAEKADAAEHLAAQAKNSSVAAALAKRDADAAAQEAEDQAKLNDAALPQARLARSSASEAEHIADTIDATASRLAAEAADARARADDFSRSAGSSAADDAKTKADVIRQRRLPPRAPAGELAAKCVKAIQAYLVRSQGDTNADDRLVLEAIEDIKKAGETTYPYTVKVILNSPSVSGTSLVRHNVVMLVNPDTGDVSDYVRRW
ncbi:MAG: hypothetical protein P4L33_12220 [Capsulimonadaceae bacterium]|nr:hypothetical protein [Capsulimonadaceae bacterium]